MDICNLFVFGPVNANEVIILKTLFVVQGTNTLDYDVHIYGF